MSTEVVEKLRVDKWLWFSRFFKTRTIASAAVSGGHLRVNNQPVRKPGHMVKVGDVLIFPKADYIRVIEILSLAGKRSSASIAITLYSDLDPPQPKPRSNKLEIATRDKGSGRPTKRERRETDKLKDFL